MKHRLPIRPFGDILRRNGGRRISQSAMEVFRDITEDWADQLAVKIIAIQKHTGRATIKRSDVKLARKML